jgi:hypothetical protein
VWKHLVDRGTNMDLVVRRTSHINERSSLIVWQSHLHSVVKQECIDLNRKYSDVFEN